MKESISHSYSSTSIPYSTKMGRMLYFQCNIKAQLPNNEITIKKKRRNQTKVKKIETTLHQRLRNKNTKKKSKKKQRNDAPRRDANDRDIFFFSLSLAFNFVSVVTWVPFFLLALFVFKFPPQEKKPECKILLLRIAPLKAVTTNWKLTKAFVQ